MSRKSKKQFINKNDAYRALLTDTLPYEVPFKFSNSGFYKALRDNDDKLNFPFPLNSVKKKVYSIPYNYKIKKDENSYRTLSVIHPLHQIECSKFYSNFEQVILNLTANNKYSLRYPSDVGSYYYEKNRKTEDTDVEWGAVDNNSESKLTSSSYFSYEKYNFMYKFYESYEFHRLERKFQNLLRMDISKCFHHIYTHSMSWAVKGKNFSKNYVNADTFDGGFDKLMQLMNYNETNGILIGPEISRVFSEIILQSIDTKVDNALSSNELTRGVDYEIRRYIDDYFIFSNNKSVSETIAQILEKNLSEFKLYINESKTISVNRPFMTGETIAKIEIGKTIDHYFSQLVNFKQDNDYSEEELLKKIWNKSSLSNSFIRDVKAIVKKNEISFDAVISFSISILIKLLKKVLNAIKNHKAAVDIKDLEKLKIFVLETTFFIFAMSPKSRSSYLICRLINLLKEEPKDGSDDSNINKAIFDEITSLIQSSSHQNKAPNIELFNLVTTSESLGRSFMLSEELLQQAFGLDADIKSLDYFRIVVSDQFRPSFPH